VMEQFASAEDLQQIESLYKNLHTLASFAHEQKVRLMLDAEQSYFQPAIDMLARNLQQEYNKTFPTIFNTYQCYLRDSSNRIEADLEHAKKNGYVFAAKLVRGAYMVQERKLAAEKNQADPIHATIEDTHRNYNNILDMLITSNQPRELMIASHNEDSILKATKLMAVNNLSTKSSGIMFGQLLGMCDHISYSLGANGYSVYKYVPYGPVGEVIPYLVRRAEENSSIMAGAVKERAILRKELLRRLLAF